MTRRSWLRLMAAGVLVVWLCLFLHWDNTEKSMIRALLVETNGDSWTVGLLYQFPEASADSSEAKAAIRLCIGRGPELSSAISAAEEALPQRADWRLCEYLLAGLDSVRQTLPACEELFLHRPYGRLASRVFGGSFSVEILKERADGSDVLPEASKTLPRPRPASISRAAASSCLSWSWKTRMHITGPKPSSSPRNRPAS